MWGIWDKQEKWQVGTTTGRNKQDMATGRNKQDNGLQREGSVDDELQGSCQDGLQGRTLAILTSLMFTNQRLEDMEGGGQDCQSVQGSIGPCRVVWTDLKTERHKTPATFWLSSSSNQKKHK
jgi:hypothetical protein